MQSIPKSVGISILPKSFGMLSEPKSIASLCIAVWFKSRNYTNFTQVRKLSSLLSTSAYLRVITRSKAVNPTHIFFTRYPHPKSLPSGKGFTFAL